MRIFKPQFLTPLLSVFDDGRRLHCVVTAIFHASFKGDLQTEQALWQFTQSDIEGSVLDEAKPKTHGEYLVHGACYARGPDVRQSFAKVTIGEHEKVLAVFGPRTYLPLGGLSEPEPFDEVPIRFTHAFGGGSFTDNPVGTGYGGGTPPQVELRGKLVTSPFDRPPVAGFGRVDVTWPQRTKRMGTYDDRWLKTRYPGVSEDFDGSFFQLALPDQWQDTFFSGNEAFSAVNMHPEHELLEGALPGVIARAFIKRTNEEFVDVAMRIDTVHLFPHRDRQVIVCRGTTSTTSDTLSDIVEAGFGLEWIDRPRSREHYEEVFATRRKKRGGARAALNDRELLPESSELPQKPARLVAPGEHLQQRSTERRVQHELDQVRQTLVEHGFSTTELDGFSTKVDTGVDLDSLEPREGGFVTDEGIQKKLADAQDAAISRIRSEAEKADPKSLPEIEKLVEKLKTGHVGPPEFSREKTRERLSDQVTLLRNMGADPAPLEAQLDDVALDQKMRELEVFVRESYRKHVQLQGVAPVLEDENSGAIRALVMERVKKGEPLASIDMTGADLSGLDLRGADMTRAFMESANLEGAKLDGAKLDFAVLARAVLSNVDLTATTLVGANLSETKLRGADLTGIDLTGAFFVGTDLTDARLASCKLDRVDFGKATLNGTDMSESTAVRPKLHKLHLEKVSLHKANWERAVFIECTISELDAREAILQNLSFIDTRVEDSVFDDATLVKLRAAKALGTTSLFQCSFVGATLHRALFRSVPMPRCDFRHADFANADFSEATLDDSTFADARGVESRFMGANVRRCNFERVDLMDALFGNALMDGATFEKANLYRADFGRSGGEGVNMSGANVKWVRTVPKREEPA